MYILYGLQNSYNKLPTMFFLSHYPVKDVHIVAEVRLLRNQAPHSESLRTQVYYTGKPRGVSTPSSEP